MELKWLEEESILHWQSHQTKEVCEPLNAVRVSEQVSCSSNVRDVKYTVVQSMCTCSLTVYSVTYTVLICDSNKAKGPNKRKHKQQRTCWQGWGKHVSP